VAWNGFGLISPIIAAFFAIPILLNVLGPEAFGILTLFLVLIGYTNIFEFGLGRSITHLLSSMPQATKEWQSRVCSSALVLGLAIGVLGGIAFWFGLSRLLFDWIQIPKALAPSAKEALAWLCLSIPLVVMGPILIGIMEANQKFKVINLVRSVTGVFLFLAPVIVSNYSTNLAAIITSMLIVRIFSVTILLFLVRCLLQIKIVPFLSHGHIAKKLLTFGGWLTLSAVIGPLLVYGDRFILSAYVGLAETTSYATPFEAVVRFLFVPAAIIGVMFPRMVGLITLNDSGVRTLYRETHLYVFLAIAPVTLVFLLMGETVLQFWLRIEDVTVMADIARVLAIALLINAMAHCPQALIQAHGKPSWTGTLHIIEAVVWMIYTPWIIAEYGATGAAYSWLVRVCISALSLYTLVHILTRQKK